MLNSLNSSWSNLRLQRKIWIYLLFYDELLVIFIIDFWHAISIKKREKYISNTTFNNNLTSSDSERKWVLYELSTFINISVLEKQRNLKKNTFKERMSAFYYCKFLFTVNHHIWKSHRKKKRKNLAVLNGKLNISFEIL